MFSGNQIIQISGDLDLDRIEYTLKFCLSLENHFRGLIWQISKKQDFCVGYGGDHIPEGWNAFPISDDTDVIALMIKKHLERQTFPEEYEYGDGITKRGFLAEAISPEDSDDLEEYSYGLLKFSPYTCYYGK